MRTLALLLALAVNAGERPLDAVQARLARGDAQGAREALRQVAEPAPTDAWACAEWLDARARVAWALGEMDRAFALGVQAQVLAERAGKELPALTAAFTPQRAWVDAACGLALRTLPLGDAGPEAATLAGALVALPECRQAGGGWIACAARLLDPSIAMPAPDKQREGRETPDQARMRLRAQLLRLACDARGGDPKAIERTLNELRQVARQRPQMAPFARWFEGELLSRDTPRRDLRLASLRFVQSAAGFDEAPWLRVAALVRAADALQSIDPQEAARLRAAADKEIP